MEKLEKRRINPIARVATLVVLVVLLFEGLVIGGVFELKARTVGKYAPWAYEPFLRLVGEHPESLPRIAVVEEVTAETDSGGRGISGLEPAAIPLLIATNDVVSGTNIVLEPTIPQEVEPEPVPVELSTNAPEKVVEQIIPVG
jgi:hypothetical protein